MEHPSARGSERFVALESAYSAPASPPATPSSEAASAFAARLRGTSAKLLGASAGSFVLAIAAMAIPGASIVAPPLFLFSPLLGLTGAGFGIAALVKGLHASPLASKAASSIALTVGNLFMTGMGALVALLATMSFTRGRQIRVGGKILLPPVETGDAWTGAGLSSSGPIGVIECDDEGTRDAVAAQWRENGRTEHASVAAFARLTLDLMALGAPPDLIADANRDALDEIRHAELCFGLARAIDGRIESPGPLPEGARARMLSRSRTLALAELAVDSMIDGALHEGVSARIIAKLARRCEAPAIQSILKEIAADEGRHAHHGWDVLRWCLAEGGEPVARAVEGALRMLPKAMSSPIPSEARDGTWERWGIMGEALESEEYEATKADLERRIAQAVAASRGLSTSTFGYGSAAVG